MTKSSEILEFETYKLDTSIMKYNLFVSCGIIKHVRHSVPFE